jgi:trigger factor
MKLNIENTSALRRKMLIEVEPDEVKRELDRAYNELRRGVVLKGFRRGHAPRNLLERFYGDQVRGDVIQRLTKEYTAKALAENDLKPVVEPEIVTEEANLPETLKFSAVFDLKPEIVIKDYQDLRVLPETVEVTDQDVDAALEQIRQRQAKLKKVEGRTAVGEGDVVLAVVEAYANGKPLSEGQQQSRLIEVSRRTLAHGVDELLVGAELGKEARATRSYAADYDHKELAGKTVEWRATVKEIYQRELPALDDEFARDQGDCQNLAELRERVHRGLVERARAQADARARQGLLDLILERNPFELPESVVVREQRAMESELGAALSAGGLAEEQVAERLRIDAEELKTRAEKRARATLVLDALAEQEGITVSDDEFADRLGAIMRQSAGRERDRLAEVYEREENRDALRGSMRREKVLDHLLARAKGETEGAGAPSQP